MDPYEVLGVRQGASEEEIKAAYKELVINTRTIRFPTWRRKSCRK